MYIHQQSKQVIHAVPGSPVSTDTTRIQDLLPRYLHVIRDTPEYLQVTQSIPSHVYENDEAAWWTEEAPFVLESLTETLEHYAPEGYRFGNTDNLTDYGYWLCSDVLIADGWTCTDPDTGQWAKKEYNIIKCQDGVHRKLPDNFVWNYFDNGDGPKDATRIDIRDYSFKTIESTINSYGYTLGITDLERGVQSIHELYGNHYLQIIAECLFESDN